MKYRVDPKAIVAPTPVEVNIVASSMDSDLEAFSHNPTDDSFAALAAQPTALPSIRTNGSSRTKLDYLPGEKPSCNILGATALGFRHRDDLREISGLLNEMGIDINVVAPLSATPDDIARRYVIATASPPKQFLDKVKR